MQQNVDGRELPEDLSDAFEHSITWEDDIWHADPVDVEGVHADARAKFRSLLDSVTSGTNRVGQARILLFHGQSGAGKTHLIRALRTSSHRAASAYFGYAQMTPDVGNYADYFLRRLVHSLEKPYDPDQGRESALSQLTSKLVDDANTIDAADLETLRDADLEPLALAQLILSLADQIMTSPRFDGQELDANVVRALLYLQRRDPSIDHRVRQYLQGRELTEMAHGAVAALDPNGGEDRAFEIISALGTVMWTLDRAALVFCIDQVEDLRFFDDAEERFQRASRDLIQIANRLPNAIIIISCLEDFYGQVRSVLAQSYIDRIEKAGPVALLENRTADEARLIIQKRLQQSAANANDPDAPIDPDELFGPTFLEEFGGLSTRRLLEHAQNRLKARFAPGGMDDDDAGGVKPGFISTLAAALGWPDDAALADADAIAPTAPANDSAHDLGAMNFHEIWDRFQSSTQPDLPADDDHSLMNVISSALKLAEVEWGRDVTVEIEEIAIADNVPTFDCTVVHKSGFRSQSRVFLCNRPPQGGGLKRQLDKVLPAMADKSCFILRASDFPPIRKNQIAQAFRKFRDGGGRSILVPAPEWEKMMTVHEFYTHHKADPGFSHWFAATKLLSNLMPIIQLMRLDLLGKELPAPVGKPRAVLPPPLPSNGSDETSGLASTLAALAAQGASAPPPFDAVDPLSEFSDTGTADAAGALDGEVLDLVDSSEDNVPLSVLLGDDADSEENIFAGREIAQGYRPITLSKGVMKRHAAVLGGSGSGKTTLALTLIEQLLLRGIPAVLIDRKGDLCSYANPDVWLPGDDESTERHAEREKLADSIDVAVYTPGRGSGRPISITLLPNGISELPEHEQQLLANLSAAALGEMLHLKNSATHQKQSGTLSVALKILGSRFTTEVTLGDLIDLLEEEDPELTELTQRMDPSGKLRRDLVAQLDSLRHRNSSLFEGGGEPMALESLLGLGPFARDGRTRLTIIYTGFLGDNENILFWVSQFLSEALRFCQRNPNDELQAVVMFDEADLYIPANAKPATAEPLQSLLKRARSAGLGLMLATQSPGDLDYKSRDQITSWFIGRVREDTALRKLKAAFQSESGLDPSAVLPSQTVGEFHLVQEGLVRAMRAQRSLITAEQVPFDRIEQLAAETKGQDERQLRLFEKS